MMRPPNDTHPIANYCDAYGLLLRSEAILRGIDDNALGVLTKSGVLVRLRQGGYCLRGVFLKADKAERHRLLCRLVIKQYAAHVTLSHSSSCLLQGGPDWGLDLSSAHLTHASGGGRRNSKVIHHLGECRVVDLRMHQGIRVTVPARAVLEVACTDGAEPALVQANHFLHLGEMTMEELRSQAARGTHWPGSIQIHPVLLLADPRIESAGETRSDFCFWRSGLPRPIPQYVVEHLDGRVAARVDFAWPEHKVIVEFDGMAKYHRFRKDGETIEEMVIREKAREDLIRELTGWTVIRLTWADLELPQHTAVRIRRAMRSLAA